MQTPPSNSDTTGDTPPVSKGWGPATRVAFRFAFVYILLIGMPFPLTLIPGPIGDLFTTQSRTFAAWVGGWALGLDVRVYEEGLGDTTADYILLAIYLLLSTGIATVWSLRARKDSYPGLYDALRVYTRYLLGSTLIFYAAIKLIRSQFPDAEPDQLLQSYGESSPQRLLWMFMGYSAAYAFFAGLMELLGAVLLFFRRTTMAGALILTAVMGNVVMINCCYDVPVKLWSGHLLLFSLFLLVPDAPRLIGLFFLSRGAPARADIRPKWPRSFERARPFLKAALIGGAVYVGLHTAGADRDPANPPLRGVYRVSGAASGVEVSHWKTVVINRRGVLVARLDDDTALRFRARVDPESKSVTLMERGKKGSAATLSYASPTPGELILRGTLHGAPTEVTLRQFEPKFPLLEGRFHWISEQQYNR